MPAGMVVLLRAFTYVDVYAEALDLAGLDPYVVGGRGYWSAQQVADALRLLACVANPLDDESLLGALASPACGAGPDALWMLRRIAGRRRHLWPALEDLFRPPPEEPPPEPAPDEAPAEEPDERELERRAQAATWSERLPDADRTRLAHFYERLTDLRAEAAQLPLDTLVERTLETFDYDLSTLLMDAGRRRTANLRKLVRIATEYEAHDGRDLRGFLDHAAARAAFSDRESEVGTATEEHSGVRLMTVHAAKGLEFETVAVADLGRSLCIGGQPPELRLAFEPETVATAAAEGPPPARVGLRLARAGAASIDTEGYRLLNEDAADAEADESGRLAYVAASRAERRLLLSGIFGESELEDTGKPRRQRSALACLLPALGVADEDGSARDAARARAPTRAGGHLRAGGAGGPHRRCRRRERQAALSRPPARRRLRPWPLAGSAPPLTELGARRRRGGAQPLATRRSPTTGAAATGSWSSASSVSTSSPTASTPERADGETDDRPDVRGERMGFGRAVHELLEWCARNGWTMPSGDVIDAALQRESAGRDAAPAGAGDARGLARLRVARRAARVRGRAPAGGRPSGPRSTAAPSCGARSTCSRPGAGDRPPTVLDYKTDALGGGAPEGLEAAYALQRDLYAAAVAEATGADRVRSAYVFLERPDAPLITRARRCGDRRRPRPDRGVGRPSPRRAASSRRTSRTRGSATTARPARRLCPHPSELTMRAAA